MRKGVIIFCLLGSGLIILGQFNAFEWLMMFLLVGAIPGTDYSVPYQAMLIILIALISLVVFRVVITEAFYKLLRGRLQRAVLERKKHFPKRRYSQI